MNIKTIFPKYQSCIMCRNRLNQGCIEQCIMADNYKWFTPQKDINLSLMPAFPLEEFILKMPNEVRKIVLALYITKIVDHLQGRL